MNMAIPNTGTQVVTRQPGKLETFIGQVLPESAWLELRRALPPHVRPDRFRRNFINAVMQNSELLSCTPQQVFREVSKAAGLGLELDPQLGEAYLVLRNSKTRDGKWIKVPNLQIGYRGMLKLARQAGESALIYAHEVAERDVFECSLGDQKSLIHKPTIFGDRGEVVGFYAVVKYKTGETDFEIMSRQQIDAIRNKSDGWKAFADNKIKDTPWNSAYEEMAKKTVLRRLLKRVPQSSDMADQLVDHLAEEDRAEFVDAEAREVPVSTPPATIAAPQVEQPKRRGRPPKDQQPTVTQQDDQPPADAGAGGDADAGGQAQLVDPTGEVDGDDIPFDAPGADDGGPVTAKDDPGPSGDDWAAGL